MVNFFYKSILFLTLFLGVSFTTSVKAQDNVIDQIVWVVGDEAILKSDVEGLRLRMQFEGYRFDGDPYCIIPEQIAVQKLFLHQAKIDSVEVSSSAVSREVERWINSIISQYGSREKVEEYLGRTIPQLREERKEQLVNEETANEVKRKITGNIKLTPSEVRRYYEQLPQDSLPFIPTTVEAQIIVLEPKIPLTEIDAVKNRLRGFTDRINKGETDFSTLALMYSEDVESAKRGGELGFMGRAEFVPEFSSAAFAMTDPKKVSNIVESEYGLHIIQLIERRGDRGNFRHILLKPKVPADELAKTTSRLDSIASDIRENKFTFEEAAAFLSADKATRNNKGLMVNNSMYQRGSDNYGTSRFTMEELPQEVAKAVDKLKVGDVSTPFKMLNTNGKEVIAVVKLKSRVDGHKANISDDYQALKSIVEDQKREEVLSKWVKKKIGETYIRINEDWKHCDFQYSGWIK